MLTRQGDRLRLQITRDQYRDFLRIVSDHGNRADIFHGAAVELDAENARVDFSAEQWAKAMCALGRWSGGILQKHGIDSREAFDAIGFIDALNEGNRSYAPYRLPEPDRAGPRIRRSKKASA